MTTRGAVLHQAPGKRNVVDIDIEEPPRSAIVTVAILKAEHLARAFAAAGDVEKQVVVPAFELTLFQKRLHGSRFDASSPSRDIPRMLDLYQSGKLRLDELITRTYTLDAINQGYADMHDGKSICGEIVY